MKKNRSNDLFVFLLFVLTGVSLGLDILECPVFGVKHVWTGGLFVIYALAVLTVYIVSKKNYLPAGAFLLTLGVMFLILGITDLGFATLWPMIMLALFFATFIWWLTSKSKFTTLLAVSVSGMVLSVAGLFDKWLLALPVIIILTGVFYLIYSVQKDKNEAPEIPVISFEKRRKEIIDQINKEKEN